MTEHEHAPAWASPPAAGTVEVGRHEPGVAIVIIRGEHDIATQPVVARALERASDCSNVVVDLSQCAFFDSTVISEFIRTSLVLDDRGDQLVLVIPAARGPSMRVAELSGLAGIMRIENSLESALARLRAGARRAAATEVHS